MSVELNITPKTIQFLEEIKFCQLGLSQDFIDTELQHNP